MPELAASITNGGVSNEKPITNSEDEAFEANPNVNIRYNPIRLVILYIVNVFLVR